MGSLGPSHWSESHPFTFELGRQNLLLGCELRGSAFRTQCSSWLGVSMSHPHLGSMLCVILVPQGTWFPSGWVAPAVESPSLSGCWVRVVCGSGLPEWLAPVNREQLGQWAHPGDSSGVYSSVFSLWACLLIVVVNSVSFSCFHGFVCVSSPSNPLPFPWMDRLQI